VKAVARKRACLARWPEYDDCRKLAEEKEVPLQRVINEALRSYEQQSANN